MNENFQKEYEAVRGATGAAGFFERETGLIEVSGKEAVMFLNGLITNDVAKLESYAWILAAFPNAQGRLLAVVRVLRFDEKFLFVTDKTTHEKVFRNLFRFTYAGDFKVEDLTEKYACFSMRGREVSGFRFQVSGFNFPASENEIAASDFNGERVFVTRAFRAAGIDVLVPKAQVETFTTELANQGAIPIGGEVREVLRIENGEPLYNVDMDETTVVLETGIDEAVSFKKGCYIGQEIIARIHFRGHVAKKLTGLILEEAAQVGDELKSAEGKAAGRITSTTFSPTLGKHIALAYARYEFLAESTRLKVNDSTAATVKNLPFVNRTS